MTAATKLTADDLEWEEPTPARSGGGIAESLCVQVVAMRSALASAFGNALTKKRPNDSRLTGLEFAGRKQLDSDRSKLYVRAVA